MVSKRLPSPVIFKKKFNGVDEKDESGACTISKKR